MYIIKASNALPFIVLCTGDGDPTLLNTFAGVVVWKDHKKDDLPNYIGKYSRTWVESSFKELKNQPVVIGIDDPAFLQQLEIDMVNEANKSKAPHVLIDGVLFILKKLCGEDVMNIKQYDGKEWVEYKA